MDEIPAIGTLLVQTNRNGVFRYRLIAIEPYVNRNDEPTVILRWSGRCSVCDAAFDQTSTYQWDRPLLRTCQAHRPPAKRDTSSA